MERWHSKQVGAASRALSGEPLLCASLKSNMGHLEAAAAAAGLSSLVAGPLLAGVVAVNAQLRRFVCDASQMRLKCVSNEASVSHSQAERAPGVDRVVGVVSHARRGAAARR